MMVGVMNLLSVVSAAMVSDPPPYTFSLDQSIVCPRDVNDAWYTQSTKMSAPIRANDSTALKDVIDSVPGILNATLGTLRAPSAMFIAHQNSVKLSESYHGSARLNAIVPVTSTSGFMIASNSKVFTSVMLYQLRDQGLLPQGLDTTVARLMPGWHEPQPPRGSTGAASRRGLTLRALATHASGLPRETPAAVNESEILTKVGAAKMLFPQFASTAYSNLGVSLLGRTLEKATNGLTWEEWVETRIMEPLGMSRSGPCVRSAEEAAAIVDGVEPAAPRHVVPRPFTNSSRCPWDAPAGGVFSTPQDMARWADFLAGTYPAPDVLDPASIAELRNSAMLQADGISAIGGGTLENAFSHGRWTFNKLGCLPGYRSATTIVPELGLSVFAAAASTCDLHGDGDAVGFPIVSQLIPPLERLLRERFEAQQRALPAAAADLVGSYDCPFAGAAHISHSADGRLRLEHVGGSAY